MIGRFSRVGVFVLTTLLAGVGFVAADPVVITFDDLRGDNLPVPRGYGGIDWLNGWTHYEFDQPPYTPHSRRQRIYPTAVAVPIGTVIERQFEFSSAELFAGAWFAGHTSLNGVDAFIQFNLYDDGVRVASSSLLAPTELPTFLASGYNGTIDRVGVVSNTAGYWVMDDVTYGSDPAPVPEPATFALMGIGLAAAWRAKRRSRPVARNT